jgi:hypothetical protein
MLRDDGEPVKLPIDHLKPLPPEGFRGDLQPGPRLWKTWRAALDLCDAWASQGPHMTFDVWIETQPGVVHADIPLLIAGEIPERFKEAK